MLQRLLIFIGIIQIVFFPVFTALAHDLIWPGEKLKALYPSAISFEQKNLYVSDVQKAFIEKALGGRLQEEDLKPSIYLAIVKATPESLARKAAAVMFIDAYGEAGKIEMGVVVGGKGEIQKVMLFENKEPEGLSQQGFLGQFEGKKTTDVFRIGTDVSAPAGRQKSAQAIASGAKRGLLIINEMFGKR